MPRRELDFYETPPHYIAALFNEVNIFGKVYEPCVGESAIADALRALPSVRKVITNDIDRKRKADLHVDARLSAAWTGNFDFVVTNPPFSDEQEILEQALDACANVAMLARLSFLEPTEDRSHLLESNPPQQVIVLPRYSFRLNDDGKRQTDNVTCAWLVWRSDHIPQSLAVYGRGRSQTAAIIRGLSE